MLKWKHTGLLAAIGIVAFVAGRAVPVSGGAVAAQPEKRAEQPDKKGGERPDIDAMMAAMPQPGPEHRVLEVMVGDWEGHVKFWMAPDSEPMESKGTLHREWVLDGRFLKEDVVGEMGDGPPFKGLSYTGFNPIDKKYESVWMENMAMHMSTSTGTYNAETKTFTFVGDMLDPMDGKRKKQTSVIDHSNPDREVMTGTCTGPDGKPFKNFEGVFERKKK